MKQSGTFQTVDRACSSYRESVFRMSWVLTATGMPSLRPVGDTGKHVSSPQGAPVSEYLDTSSIELPAPGCCWPVGRAAAASS